MNLEALAAAPARCRVVKGSPEVKTGLEADRLPVKGERHWQGRLNPADYGDNYPGRAKCYDPGRDDPTILKVGFAE